MKKKIFLFVILAIIGVVGAIYLYNVIEIKTAPTIQELSEAYPWTPPKDWFKTDTVTVKGCIEDYDAEKFGFTSMECIYNDIFEKDGNIMVIDIADDGTFYKKIVASYPIKEMFFPNQSNVDLRSIPFFARPGETIDITVRKGKSGKYECIYNSGSSRDVERWLRTADKYKNVFWLPSNFVTDFDEANEMAELLLKKALSKLKKIGKREHYTPMEMQLALADLQVRYGAFFMQRARDYAYSLKEYHENSDGSHSTEITDSAEWEKVLDAKNYTVLQHIDFDNPLLFTNDVSYLLNTIQFAQPVENGMYKGVLEKDGGMLVTFKNYSTLLANYLAVLHDIMGTDKNNLMVQLCAYKEFFSRFDEWRAYEELPKDNMTQTEKEKYLANLPTLNNIYPLYLETFSEPYFREKAEQCYTDRMAQTDIATPLPDAPMADLFHSLCDKYPGRILIIDFWGMSCGPCRADIQSSKQKRAEIAKRDDVKLIFIAGERTTEGSDEYKKYVAEWLSDEETICVTNTDFTRLQEFFRFNGIPHQEVITPDCRRVRDDLRIYGLDNIDNYLQRLKEKLNI